MAVLPHRCLHVLLSCPLLTGPKRGQDGAIARSGRGGHGQSGAGLLPVSERPQACGLGARQGLPRVSGWNGARQSLRLPSR